MTNLLHRLGFTYRKPKHVPGKANQKAQQAFIEQYNELKANKSKHDRIYFLDAVHSLHNSQPAYGWMKKGFDYTIKSNTGRQRVNINGAYNIEDHKVVIEESERVNAQSTVELFEKMLKFLLPYSPNLNIIERLWKLFKRKTTYNSYYEKFAVFKKQCLNFFENIEEYKIELHSLMTDNFQLI